MLCEGEDYSFDQDNIPNISNIPNHIKNINFINPTNSIPNEKEIIPEEVSNPEGGLNPIENLNFPQNPYSYLMKYPNTQGNEGYPANFPTGEIQKMIQIHSKISPMTSLPHTRPQSRPQSSRQSIHHHHHHPGNYY